MSNNKTQKPTIEDILELSGIDILHPGGFKITKRIGEIVSMKGKEVLDVACGRGTLPCYYAKEFKAKITGIDLNPEMIESAIKRATREEVEDLTEFKVADALALPFEDNCFDVVINECAVGLTPNPQKCLDEMARVTKHGGYVVIHENTWLANMTEEKKEEIARRLGTIPYTLSEWKEMMQKSGLTNLWTEDWSGLENLYKMRPDRKVRSLDGMFSLWEKIFNLFPKIVSKYGIKGIFYANESARKINPLYSNGKLGYFLIRGQKP
jgi:ubiquinone/menaquinone biosynthesis C-methylase UbiE